MSGSRQQVWRAARPATTAEARQCADVRAWAQCLRRNTRSDGCEVQRTLRTPSPLLPRGAVRWWGTAAGSAPEAIHTVVAGRG